MSKASKALELHQQSARGFEQARDCLVLATGAPPEQCAQIVRAIAQFTMADYASRLQGYDGPSV